MKIMPAPALAELIAHNLQGILEELKGRRFWFAILIIISIIYFT